MHHQTPVRVTGEEVRYNLTESLGVKALVYVLDGIVYIFFRRGDSSEHVSAFSVVHNLFSQDFQYFVLERQI